MANSDKQSQVALIESYLGDLAVDVRTALSQLRAVIRSAAPTAEEALIYGAPGFRLDGALVCYSAHKSHCSFYPMSPKLLDNLRDELTGFRAAKGTLRFTPDRPLPNALVRKIVLERIAENRARTKDRKARATRT